MPRISEVRPLPLPPFHPLARSFTAVAIAGLVFLAACGDGITEPNPDELPAAETRDVAAPVVATTRESNPLIALATCGAATEYKLTNLRHTPGTVTVTNDATNLYITYQITKDDWFISDTRLAVAKTYAAIPQDHKRRPLPWSFPYAGEHEPVVKSVTYSIKLSELGVGGGDNVVVAAMAGVVHPKTRSYSGPWEWLVMWGLGNIAGRSLETIHNYTITPCAPPPTPGPSTGGIVTITFDDGWLNTYTTAYPVLRELGLKGNIAVNPDPIDQSWIGYMTMANLRELHGAGWSIVSHSLSHRDLTTLTDAELHRELRDSKAWIERNGFGPSDVFVVPFHRWDTRERNAIAQYYARARGYTVNQFVPARFVKVPVSAAEGLNLTGYESEFAPYTTPEGRAQTLEYVERAVREGEFIDLFFHQITAEQLPAFRTLMQELVKYKSSIKTWKDFSVSMTP